jgi:hypothetical protein
MEPALPVAMVELGKRALFLAHPFTMLAAVVGVFITLGHPAQAEMVGVVLAL